MILVAGQIKPANGRLPTPDLDSKVFPFPYARKLIIYTCKRGLEWNFLCDRKCFGLQLLVKTTVMLLVLPAYY